MASETRLSPNNGIAFLQGFLARPKEVGSIIPSSRFLEKKLVDIAGLATAKVVVELGPGTGGTTEAFLKAMPQDAKLLAIEISPEFARRLQERFTDPRLIVWNGSAEHILQALDEHKLEKADAILSGIPFSTMPKEVAVNILRSIRESLTPGGCFVAYQFRDHVEKLGTPELGPAEEFSEVRNIPPVKIFRWRR